MKNWYYVIVIIVLSVSCSSDNDGNRCNALLNVGVNATINLNLPQFSYSPFFNCAKSVLARTNLFQSDKPKPFFPRIGGRRVAAVGVVGVVVAVAVVPCCGLSDLGGGMVVSFM